MFELLYEPLIITEDLKPWEIALIPWDTETFGFGVSALKPCYGNKYIHMADSLKEALEAYSKSKGVHLITAAIPAEERATSVFLQGAGFDFIDVTLRVTYENLEDLPMPCNTALSVVPATPDEIEIIADIAGCSFQHGRYHQDIYLSRSLADQRYRDWVLRCLDPENPQEVLAVKFEDAICGFSVVEHAGGEGYLHLHAISSKWQGRRLGFEMILQSLRYLYNSGAKSIDTKISASNLKAVNMHSQLNGRFADVEYLWHWHRKDQNELLDEGK